MEPMAGDSMTAVYSRCGILVLETVVDGNCGIDVMCQMEQIEASAENMINIRRDISDYLLERAGQRWMHELLVACQELEPAK